MVWSCAVMVFVLCFRGRFCLPGLFVCICYYSTLPSTYLSSFPRRMGNGHLFIVYWKPTWHREVGLAQGLGHYASQSSESASMNKEDLSQQSSAAAEVRWAGERNGAPWAGGGGAREGPQWEKWGHLPVSSMLLLTRFERNSFFLPKICYWYTSVFKSKLKFDLNYLFKLRSKWNCLRILIQITYVCRSFFKQGCLMFHWGP